MTTLYPGDHRNADGVVLRVHDNGTAARVLTVGDTTHVAAILDIDTFVAELGPFEPLDVEPTDPEPEPTPAAAPSTRKAAKTEEAEAA